MLSHAFVNRCLGSSFFLLICLVLAGCIAGPFPTVDRTEVSDRTGVSGPTKMGDRTEIEGKDLVILQSSRSPAFAGVTQAIAEKLKGSVTVLSLKGSTNAEAEVARQLQANRDRVVVAVGLAAALAARKLRGTKVIFCQVFNYEEFDLLTPWMKGVSATPPVSQQFQVWKQLDPNLKRVGVITGSGLHDLVAEARVAAAANGIEIKHAEVRYDLETLYAFRQLSPDIQALWLLPDNRVLSRNTLRDILSYSRQHGKQVVVFSAQLLSLGGMMTFESVHGDIADQVIARSKHALQTNGPDIPGPSMRPLTQLDIKINPLAVKQLGLPFPAELRGSAHVP